MLRIAIGVVLVILIGYGLIEARPLILGPSITLSPVTTVGTTTDGVITVSGNVQRAIALSLDGAPLLMDENGSFSSTLTLPQGGSILTLVAVNRFGRSTTDRIPVFVH